MIRNIFKAVILVIVSAIFFIFLGLIALDNFLAPAIEKKIYQVITERVARYVDVAEVNVKLPEAIVRVKGFELAPCIAGRYHISMNIEEALFHISLLNTFLQQRLIFDEVSIEKGSLFLEKIVQPDSAAAPASHNAHAFTPPAAKPVSLIEETWFTELYINRLLAKNVNVRFKDETSSELPLRIEFCDIEGAVERLLVSLKEIGNFKGTLRLGARFNSTIEENINTNVPSTVLLKARIDIISDVKCRNNELKSSHDVHIYDVKLNAVMPKGDDALFTLPAVTVANFFNDYDGDVKFSFNITGRLDDPKFEPCPVIQNVLSKAMGDRIAARLKELPRDIAKISQKAAEGKLDIMEKAQIWIKELQAHFESFRRRMSDEQ